MSDILFMVENDDMADKDNNISNNKSYDNLWYNS